MNLLRLSEQERNALGNELSRTEGGGVQVPIGAIVPVIGTIKYYGYLETNGTVYKKKDYPELWKFFVDSGINDLFEISSTQFKIPDTRGRFLRSACAGHDNSTDPDFNRKVGSMQSDAMQRIQGEVHVNLDIGEATPPKGAFYRTRMDTELVLHSNAVHGENVNNQDILFDSGRVTRTATETRPSNIATTFYIRAY